jgi:hypothetical protein
MPFHTSSRVAAAQAQDAPSDSGTPHDGQTRGSAKIRSAGEEPKHLD